MTEFDLGSASLSNMGSTVWTNTYVVTELCNKDAGIMTTICVLLIKVVLSCRSQHCVPVGRTFHTSGLVAYVLPAVALVVALIALAVALLK